MASAHVASWNQSGGPRIPGWRGSGLRRGGPAAVPALRLPRPLSWPGRCPGPACRAGPPGLRRRRLGFWPPRRSPCPSWRPVPAACLGADISPGPHRLDRRRGADAGRLIIRGLADRRGDHVRRPVRALGDRAGRILERGGHLAPGLARQDLRVVLGAVDEVLAAEVDERDGARVGEARTAGCRTWRTARSARRWASAAPSLPSRSASRPG